MLMVMVMVLLVVVVVCDERFNVGVLVLVCI